jgi:hypothetical protein
VIHSRLLLAVLVLAGLGLSAAAAPAPTPAPASQGPVSDFLRRRAELPAGEPPQVVSLRGNEETITAIHNRVVFVPATQNVAVEMEGRTVVEQRTVLVPQAQTWRRAAAVKDCKFYRVGKEGKLEAIEADKVAEQWKKPTEVLAGPSAEVDPRHLALIKPGTLFLVLPDARKMPPVVPVPPPPPTPIQPKRD